MQPLRAIADPKDIKDARARVDPQADPDSRADQERPVRREFLVLLDLRERLETGVPRARRVPEALSAPEARKVCQI